MLIYVTKVKYLQNYTVELTFNDNKKGIADLESELYGTVFEPLLDKKIFATVKVDSDLDTICWENRADLAPEFLYYRCFKDDVSLQEQFLKWGYEQVPQSHITANDFPIGVK